MSNFTATYLMHSSSLSEMEVLQKRLQRHLDSGKAVNPDGSLRFLDETVEDEQTNAVMDERGRPCSSGAITDEEENQERSQVSSDTPVTGLSTTNAILLDIKEEMVKSRKLIMKRLNSIQSPLNSSRGSPPPPDADVRMCNNRNPNQ